MEQFLHIVAAAASSDDPAVRWSGLGLATVMLLAMALRVYVMRKAEEDSREYNARVAALPEADRALLRKPKGVPPGLHVVGTLLLSGSAAFAVAPGARLIREASYHCPPRCPPGEECVEGGNGRRFCGKQAKPPQPPQPPPSEPESAALLQLTPTYYRRDPFVRDSLD